MKFKHKRQHSQKAVEGVMDKLISELKRLAEKMRKDLVSRHYEYHTTALSNLEKRLADTDLSSSMLPWDIKEDYRDSIQYLERDPVRRTYSGKRRETAGAEIQKRVEQEVEGILQHWISKVESKLKPILLGKNFSFDGSTSANQGSVECSLSFQLAEGSFRIKTQVVYVVNERGTHFARYPLTFHDAVVHGKKVAGNQRSVAKAFDSH